MDNDDEVRGHGAWESEADAIGAAMNEVMEVIFSRADEGVARTRVQQILRAHPNQRSVVEGYVGKAFSQRPSYISRRAYRLVMGSNVHTGSAAEGVFAIERELGWTPLRDAFAQLAQRDSRLTELADRTVRRDAAAPSDKSAARGTFSGEFFGPSEDAELETLIGPKALTRDPVLRSHVAVSVARAYLGAVPGPEYAVDPDAPLWEWQGAHDRCRLPWPHGMTL